VVEGREGRGMPGPTRAELERTAREQLAEPPGSLLPGWSGGLDGIGDRGGVRSPAAGQRGARPSSLRNRWQRGSSRLLGGR